MQTIEKIFEDFFHAVGNIEHLGTTAYETAKSALRKHAELAEEYKEVGEDHNPVHWRRFSFKSAETGKLKLSDGRDISLDDMKATYADNLNKQCQWLLVDAYELFEKFLYQAYAYVGFDDSRNWRCSDFGDALLSDIEGKEYSWFLERVRASYKNKAEDILKRMRALYPTFAALEDTNELGVSLRFMTIFTAQIRHQVVHAGGKMESVDDFLAVLFKKSGIPQNSDAGKNMAEYCSIYFSEVDQGPRISMFNAYTEFAPGLRATHSPLDMACSLLLSHAHALTSAIRKARRA